MWAKFCAGSCALANSLPPATATSSATPALPAGVLVFERGWLSSNNVLLLGTKQSVLIDSGYCSHSAQTLALVRGALDKRPLDYLLNTHLHSDHCGGNAALQAAYPALQTLIPPGQAQPVRDWDEPALSYKPTGQSCPRFVYTALLQPGTTITLGQQQWQIHAAPGHDPHSVILFEPQSRTLISADALWQNGFGVIFEELEGRQAFAEVAATLDLIEALKPSTVIPGHGAVFTDVAAALERARARLAAFRQDPKRHARYGIKVLLKFKLLEQQALETNAFLAWAEALPYLQRVHQHYFSQLHARAWLQQLLDELVSSGAARLEAQNVYNA